DTGGNVGTNGNLDGNGATTTINGTLSTPKSGVGNCTAANVTAATVAGFATVEEGLVQLPQPITLPTPPNITPPTSNITFNSGGCPAGAPFCTGSAGGSTISPPTASTVIQMGNVNLNGSAIVHMKAGIYELNSLTLNGNSKIVVDTGPVIIKIKGQGVTTPLDLAGGGVSNPSLDPAKLQFVYAGTGNLDVAGAGVDELQLRRIERRVGDAAASEIERRGHTLALDLDNHWTGVHDDLRVAVQRQAVQLVNPCLHMNDCTAVQVDVAHLDDGAR